MKLVEQKVISYPKIRALPYVESELRGRDVVVQEKLDGSNAAIVRDQDGTFYLQSRTQVLGPEHRSGMFGPFMDWFNHVLASGVLSRMYPGNVLYGEVLHNGGKIKYTSPSTPPFVGFDFRYKDEDYDYFHDYEYARRVMTLMGIHYADVIYTGLYTGVEANLGEYIGGYEGVRVNKPATEGVVVKSYPTETEQVIGGIGEYRELMIAGKVVSEQFREKTRVKATKNLASPIAEIVQTFLTPARYDKAHMRLRERGLNPDHSPHLLVGELNKDIFQEESESISSMLLKLYKKDLSREIAQRTLRIAEDRAMMMIGIPGELYEEENQS